MKPNQATLNLVKEFEGKRLTAYRDSVGVWTIGYGTTARAGVGISPSAGMTITEAEAEEYLRRGLEKFGKQILPSIKAPITDNEYGAFLSLAYNIGPTAFKKSTALRRFNAGDRRGAAEAMLWFNKAGGKTLRGLVRRREAEVKLFHTPTAAPAPPPRKQHWLMSLLMAALSMFGGRKCNEKTYKRETAVVMLIFLGCMTVWGVENPQAMSAVELLVWPVMGFVGVAFGFDAYSKQIAGGAT